LRFGAPLLGHLYTNQPGIIMTYILSTHKPKLHENEKKQVYHWWMNVIRYAGTIVRSLPKNTSSVTIIVTEAVSNYNGVLSYEGEIGSTPVDHIKFETESDALAFVLRFS
jgi:hypothetical protein